MRKLQLVVLFAVLAGLVLALPPASSAQIAIGVSVRIGPPPLRVVAVQPMCPGPGYFWTPGYWADGPAGYYWVPGAWVLPPRPGLLWTPGYWGWEGGYYHWHVGYWGPHVGFYGGINYGFGYFGAGFVGGHWDHDRFYYNTAVWHVNTRVVHNVYIDRTYVRDVHVNRVSYNGGRGGIEARPSRDDERWAHEQHWNATPMQTRHEESFRGNRANYHSFQPPNRGERNRMERPNDRGAQGRPNQNFERPNYRGNQGRSNRNFERPNNRGNQERGNENRGGNRGRGNDRGRGPQGKPQHEGKPDHGRGRR